MTWRGVLQLGKGAACAGLITFAFACGAPSDEAHLQQLDDDITMLKDGLSDIKNSVQQLYDKLEESDKSPQNFQALEKRVADFEKFMVDTARTPGVDAQQIKAINDKLMQLDNTLKVVSSEVENVRRGGRGGGSAAGNPVAPVNPGPTPTVGEAPAGTAATATPVVEAPAPRDTGRFRAPRGGVDGVVGTLPPAVNPRGGGGRSGNGRAAGPRGGTEVVGGVGGTASVDAGGAPKPAPVEAKAPQKGTYYKLKAGETLEDVAKKLNVPIEALRKENNAGGRRVVPGSDIWVPAAN